MLERNFYRRGWGIACIVLLAILIPRASWAGSSPHTLMVKKPPILDTCPEVFDHELDTMRGRYDAYYFGLDIIINLTGSGPFLTLTPHLNMPLETVITPTGISFRDVNVSYLAGIGRHSVYQSVQVTGDNKIVTGVINLNILIPRTMFTKPPDLGLRNGSLIGIKY